MPRLSENPRPKPRVRAGKVEFWKFVLALNKQATASWFGWGLGQIFFGNFPKKFKRTL
jgi:hypothetical protein